MTDGDDDSDDAHDPKPTTSFEIREANGFHIEISGLDFNAPGTDVLGVCLILSEPPTRDHPKGRALLSIHPASEDTAVAWSVDRLRRLMIRILGATDELLSAVPKGGVH